MTSIYRFSLALVFLLATFATVSAQPKLAKPTLSDVDRVRIAEAFRIGDTLGDRVWKGWSKAPFAVLLVTPEHEFLIRHPRPSNDFTLIGKDAMLKSNVYFRKRTFDQGLLATFPAVGGISTIVIGQPENTESKTTTRWIITVLHEHFHQLQDSQPNSFVEAVALGLSHGDQTGMWMLNYPFPYDSDDVVQQVAALSKLLASALERKSKQDFDRSLSAYLEARAQLQKSMSTDDYKYLSFQLWKEGIARYTEYRIARLAATNLRPSRNVRALKDFTTFAQAADQIRSEIIGSMSAMNLKESRRGAVYPWGAAEGLLLDRANPQWQRLYFLDKFSLDKYFPKKGS